LAIPVLYFPVVIPSVVSFIQFRVWVGVVSLVVGKECAGGVGWWVAPREGVEE